MPVLVFGAGAVAAALTGAAVQVPLLLLAAGLVLALVLAPLAVRRGRSACLSQHH